MLFVYYRNKFYVDSVIEKREIAFTQPTEAGRRFYQKYMRDVIAPLLTYRPPSER